MNMIPVASSNIYSVGYDDDILYVRFHSGGLYAYFGVPEYVYSNMLHAPSKGKYLHAHVKGHYRYQRIG